MTDRAGLRRLTRPSAVSRCWSRTVALLAVLTLTLTACLPVPAPPLREASSVAGSVANVFTSLGSTGTASAPIKALVGPVPFPIEANVG